MFCNYCCKTDNYKEITLFNTSSVSFQNYKL